MDNKLLAEKLLEASNIIHKQAMRGSANYMIVSSQVASVLNNLGKNNKRKEKIKIIFNVHT